ncbi:MAG: gliding motility-associated C-terminal domain-containing protein [Chryseolinea sp.]
MKTHAQEYSDSKIRCTSLRIGHHFFIVLIVALVLNVFTLYGQVSNTSPTFDLGSETGLSAGQASASKNISKLLRVSDKDRGQLLTWSILTAPVVGTVSGFPAFALSGRASIAPDATLLYKPTPGQVGMDEFTIEISDGLNSSILIVHVTLLEAEPPSDPGNIDAINQSDTSRTISIVQQWNDINVPFGTFYEDLVLPDYAGVTYGNGEGEVLPISWYPSNFNGNVSGPYLLTGDLLLTPGSINDAYKKAQITIRVLPNLSPEKIILNDSILGSWPFEDPEFPPNLFTTQDPDDEVHNYQLVDGPGDSDNCKFSVDGGILIMKDRSYLEDQNKFLIRVRSTDSNNNSIEQAFIIYYLPQGSSEETKTVEVPNAFSPNGDGINDVWIVPELKDYQNVDIKVFDRSGALMFHTSNPLQGWDGRNPNGKVIAGAYYYAIKVGEINLKKQGVLILLTN